jgi:hypothetical protein
MAEMSGMSEFEYRLLNALSETTPYSVPELAESTGLLTTQGLSARPR